MGDHEGRIDFALFDALQQLGQVVLHGSLRHSECEAAIDCRSHWNLVKQSTVYAYDGYRSEVAAAMNGLAQNMRTIRAHERGDLYSVDYGIEAGADVRFRADGIDAGVRAPPVSELLDPIVDVFLLEIEC